jgi:hypothetical protein
MSRSFDIATDYPLTVQQVHAAYRDERYWLARLARSGAEKMTLDRITLGADGSVEAATTQVVPRDKLPGPVTRLLAGGLHIKRTEKWGPIQGGRATGTVAATTPGAPVRISGSLELIPLGADSRLRCKVVVEVKVPLLGSSFEGVIGNRLADLVAAEQRFTTAWINENP